MAEESSIAEEQKVARDSVSEFRFTRPYRLSQKNDIRQVFQFGTKRRLPEMGVFYRTNEVNHPRLCVSVSKKFFPKASSRNLIKRLAKESFRLHQSELLAIDVVMVMYKPLSLLDRKKIRDILDKQWQRLR